MSTSIEDYRARRAELMRRYLSYYPEGAPLPGTEEERRDLRAALNVVRKKIIRLIVRQVLALRGKA